MNSLMDISHFRPQTPSKHLKLPSSSRPSRRRRLSVVRSVVAADSFQRLEHDHGVATDYGHADPDFLAALLLLHRFVQHEVQEHIVATEDANNLATAVQLDKQSLVEVLL